MKALDQALGAHLAVAATTLYGLVGTRVYQLTAPENSAKPYVRYQQVAGGQTNETPTDFVEAVYMVVGVGDTLASASAVDAAIETRLHNVSISVTGWTHVSAMRESDIQFNELVNGALVWHIGAQYRIRISK